MDIFVNDGKIESYISNVRGGIKDNELLDIFDSVLIEEQDDFGEGSLSDENKCYVDNLLSKSVLILEAQRKHTKILMFFAFLIFSLVLSSFF